MAFDLVVFVLFALPGIFGAGSIMPKKLHPFEGLEYGVVVLVTGIFTWITLVYCLFLLDQMNMSVYFLWFFSILGIIKIGRSSKKLITAVQKNKKQLAGISIGAMLLAYPVLFNGTTNARGMWFYGVNEHDGLWHVALMKTLLTNFSKHIPTYSGQNLEGYHLLVDIFGASFSPAFSISAMHVVFQILPVFFGWLLVASLFLLARRIYKNSTDAWIVVGMFLFGGSLGYVVSFITQRNSSWESMFWAQQGISTMINLPFALSLLGVFTSLLLFAKAAQSKFSGSALVLALFLGTFLLGVKVYAGILMILSYGLWSLYRLKREKKYSPLIFRLIILSLGLFYIFPSLNRAGNAFLYEPGWFIKTMMTSLDRVNVPQWEIARIRYSSNTFINIGLWLTGLIIFVLGNFGIKSLGVVGLAQSIKRKTDKDLNLVLLTLIGSGLLFPLLLIQNGMSWNTIQFMYYPLALSCLGIPAFLKHASLDKKPIILALLIIISAPSVVQMLYFTTQNYQQKNHARLVSASELHALKFLEQQASGIVLSPYDESALIPAFTGKISYFADPTQAQILLLDYEQRRTELRRVFIECMPENQLIDLMKANDLTYVYLPKLRNPDCITEIEKNQQLEEIYNNEQAMIWKIKEI
jgi:hypothetical protein